MGARHETTMDSEAHQKSGTMGKKGNMVKSGFYLSTSIIIIMTIIIIILKLIVTIISTIISVMLI